MQPHISPPERHTKSLADMTLEELWRLFPIRLTPNSEQWAAWAAEEMELLSSAVLNHIEICIHHIGSTAIKGIWAKPIIDLLVETDCHNFPEIKHRLEQTGWICMSEEEKRISFNKGYTPTGYAERVFHLHLRTKGDNDEILFRDYLNANPNVAKQYEKLKLSIWKRYEYDRDGYTDAKSEFVSHYTQHAKSATEFQ